MRIRQPNSVTSAGNLPHHDDCTTDEKSPSQSPPPLVNFMDRPRLTPGSEASARNDETNTAYLKPDFIDPFLSGKNETVCPSPLALLAKTCQNIGQMLEANSRSANVIQTTANSYMKTATTCSPSYSASVNQPTPINNLRMNRMKKINSVDRKVPFQSSQSNSISDRYKWNRELITTSSNLEQLGFDRTEVVSSTSPHNRNYEKIIPFYSRNSSDTSVQSSAFITSRETLHLPASPNSSLYAIGKRSVSESPAHGHTTSNALEQLARLSSSLPVADSTQLHPNHLMSNSIGKGKPNWVPQPSGCKRARRPTDPCYHIAESSSISPNKRMNLDTTLPEIKHNSCHEAGELEMWRKFLKAVTDSVERNDSRHRVQSPDISQQTLSRGFMDLFNRVMTTHRSAYFDTVNDKPKDYVKSENTQSKLNTSAIHIPHPAALLTKLNCTAESNRTFSPSSMALGCPICGNHYNNQFEFYTHFYAHMMQYHAEYSKSRDNLQMTYDKTNFDPIDEHPTFTHTTEQMSAGSTVVSDSRYASLLKYYADAIASSHQQNGLRESLNRSTDAFNSINVEKSMEAQRKLADFGFYSSWMRLLASYPSTYDAVNQNRQSEQQSPFFTSPNSTQSSHLLWSHLLNPTSSQLTVQPNV